MVGVGVSDGLTGKNSSVASHFLVDSGTEVILYKYECACADRCHVRIIPFVAHYISSVLVSCDPRVRKTILSSSYVL